MLDYLSYLMGAEKISDQSLIALGIQIKAKDGNHRQLVISSQSLEPYLKLIEEKLDNGFWNEVVGKDQIIFLFKLKDGTIKRYILSLENEQEIDELCAKLNNEPSDKTANVYKYISENDFYHDFMIKHYAEMINR